MLASANTFDTHHLIFDNRFVILNEFIGTKLDLENKVEDKGGWVAYCFYVNLVITNNSEGKGEILAERSGVRATPLDAVSLEIFCRNNKCQT